MADVSMSPMLLDQWKIYINIPIGYNDVFINIYFLIIYLWWSILDCKNSFCNVALLLLHLHREKMNISLVRWPLKNGSGVQCSSWRSSSINVHINVTHSLINCSANDIYYNNCAITSIQTSNLIIIYLFAI